MNRKFHLALFGLLLAIFLQPASLLAQAGDPCDGVPSIPVGMARRGTLVSLLTNYDVYYSDRRDVTGRYVLCWDETDELSVPIQVTSPLSFQIKDGHDIYIDFRGLTLRKDSTFPEGKALFTLLPPKFAGRGVEIRGLILDGVDRSNICLNILADGTHVISSQVSNCSEGVRVAASNVTLGLDWPRRNNIYNNSGAAISESEGAINNLWAFNSIYGNGTGIVSSRAAPTLALDPDSGKAVRCTRNSDGSRRRAIHFSGVPGPGEMEIYLINVPINQGRELLGTCSIDTSGVCTLDTLNLSPPLSVDDCGRRGVYVTAIYTSADSSTAYLIEIFELKGQEGTIIMPAEEGPIVGPPAAHGEDQGNENDASGGDGSGDLGNSTDQLAYNDLYPESAGEQRQEDEAGASAAGADTAPRSSAPCSSITGVAPNANNVALPIILTLIPLLSFGIRRLRRPKS